MKATNWIRTSLRSYAAGAGSHKITADISKGLSHNPKEEQQIEIDLRKNDGSICILTFSKNEARSIADGINKILEDLR